MPKNLIIAALALALSGCASNSGTLRGLYYWGHEVETFHPCGSVQEFWVVGENSLLQPLRDETTKLSQLKGQPYQPIYVEVTAVSEGRADDGFAADYDGVYRFSAVHNVAVVSPPGCKAHG